MALAVYVAEDVLVSHQWEMPQYRGIPGPKRGSGWAGEWGWVDMRDFWYSIGNVNELNT